MAACRLESMVRTTFQDELEAAEGRLMAQGRMVRQQLERVMEALVRRDDDLARKVIEEDDSVDDIYIAIQARVLNLLALQAPVAGDLRLVSAILHSNMHIERMGDLAVNIAKFVLDQHPYPPQSPMMQRLREMGSRAGEMLDSALMAFAQRDIDRAEEL